MKKKILIVDDQADIRRLITLTLGQSFTVQEASDGVCAIAQIETNKPDAVILDIMMPGEFDGLDVLEKIKGNEATRATYVVMLTAKGMISDIDKAMSCGADAYLIKPFSPLHLLRILHDHIGD